MSAQGATATAFMADTNRMMQSVIPRRYQQTFTEPAEKGRIHGKAAHVYGQSDIGEHSAEVIRHAKEALKYEREPIQRGWLFMYLGCASEASSHDPATFIQRRAEATRWLLKGYAELLPYNLPAEEPELPSVEKLGGELTLNDGGEIDSEQVALEVRHAAQMKARHDAEFIRELVQRRAIYVGRLRELFGRLHDLYDKDSDAKERLKETATEVLRDLTTIQKLGEYVWPVVHQPQSP